MTTILTGLRKSLSVEFGIPADIKFLFKKKEVDGSTSIEEITAHKCILALASDVFKRGFYGRLEDNGNIDITDVTKEAFEAMISFIYDKETNVSSHDFDMLCSIYYLADKYNIAELEKETLEAIRSKEISAENVIDVGVLALQYAVHDKLAEALYEASANSLSRVYNGELNEAVEYLNGIIDKDDSLDLIRYKSVWNIIARLSKITRATTTLCVNCNAFPCITGVRLSRDNFVQGAKIRAIAGGRLVQGSSLEIGDYFEGVDKKGVAYESAALKCYVFNC